MISTELYAGQGLGNQLWCYVTTRVIALDRGYDFGIESPERFKGTDFMSLNFGLPVKGIRHQYEERKILHPLNGSDIRIHDPNLVGVADDTRIDGYMQDERYIVYRKDEIRSWLQVKPEYDCRDYCSDDVCVINFRGGGYRFDVDFFLPRRYWKDAIAHMRKVNPHFRFVVVTDDVKTAREFFPDFEVNHWNIGKDYAVIKNAKYLILSNSSFAFFPAWLSTDLKSCIAPKYWGRYNISDGYWSLGYNIVKGWKYLDRTGQLQDSETCERELEGYMHQHPEIYAGTTEFKPSLTNWIRNNTCIFSALQADIGVVSSLSWLIHARSLRGAIWIKDRLDQLARKARRPLSILLSFYERTVRHVRWNIRERQARKHWLPAGELTEYRKKIKVYDAFTFFNELDLLEIRLNMLDPHVDYFVIVEATETFSGHPKPLYFKENAARFERWKHKIVHVVVDDLPKNEDELRGRLRDPGPMSPLDTLIIRNALASPTVGKDPQGKSVPTWLREFYNKECIQRGLIGLDKDDFCYISDVDEIWNPLLVMDYSKDDVFKPRQIGYMYYLNYRSSEDEWFGWSGTIATKYKNFKDACLTDLRGHRLMAKRYIFLKNGGWHFSFQGGLEGAKKKIRDYKHFWYKPEETLKHLEKRFQSGRHYRGNVRLSIDERYLPKYLLENKKKYENLFKKP